MKNIILLLCLLCSHYLQAGNDPRPQPVYSIVREIHELEWYEQQADLWKASLDQQANNPDGWLNYYRAARNIRILSGESKKHTIANIMAGIELHAKGSFTYHFVRYLESPDRFGDDTELQKAIALAPDRWEYYPDLLNINLVKYNPDALKTISEQWLASAQMSPGILAWNYNALIGLPADAILLTCGDNDTYPALLLQHGRGFRTDVLVVNEYLCALGDYRKRVFEKAGIEDPAKGQDVADSDSLVQHLIKNTKRPVYLMINTRYQRTEQFAEQLYLTGLTFRYSPTNYDNMAELLDNYEHLWLKDQLKTRVLTDISASVLDQINANYLAALIKLHRHYMEKGDKALAAETKAMMLDIAQRADYMDMVREYLDETIIWTSKPILSINIKSLEKSMKALSPKLYAAEAELSNEQYELFLQDLLKRHEFDKLNQARIADKDWKRYLPADAQHLSPKDYFAHSAFDGPNFPVVSISYDAALLYCDWLTQQYNDADPKKRQYKKVKFRLPSEAEWEQAARANRAAVLYPWGGNMVTNQKGCFLGNFNVEREKPCEGCPAKAEANDGGWFTTPVTTYFPNDLGLYNMSGNVSEMVNAKGVAKGGSWYHSPDAAKITAQQTYEGAQPYVGFRIFMEVIEQ